jgi:hypothetical protein
MKSLIWQTLEHRIKKGWESSTTTKEWILGFGEISLLVYWLLTDVTLFPFFGVSTWSGTIPTIFATIGILRLVSWCVNSFKFRRLVSLGGLFISSWSVGYALITGFRGIDVWVMSGFMYMNTWVYLRLGRTHGF